MNRSKIEWCDHTWNPVTGCNHNCSYCYARTRKNEMITLLARAQRGKLPKQFGFVCKDCFKELCEELELEMPKLAELTNSKT